MSFQVSGSRSVWQRLTPLAWFALLVLSALAGLLLVGLTSCAWREYTPAPETAAPTVTETITETPTRVPPTATAVPTETAGFPAYWAAGMYQDAEGLWWPDEAVRAEVQQIVEAHFVECGEIVSGPQNLVLENTTDAQARMCYSGQQLNGWFFEQRRYFDSGQFPETTGIFDSLYTVQGFGEDGLTCLLGQTLLGGDILRYDPTTGEWAREEIPPDGLVDGIQNLGLAIYQMRYDEGDGRWKIDAFIQWIPRPAP